MRPTSIADAKKEQARHTPRRALAGFGGVRCNECGEKWNVDGCPSRIAADAFLESAGAVELCQRITDHPRFPSSGPGMVARPVRSAA